MKKFFILLPLLIMLTFLMTACTIVKNDDGSIAIAGWGPHMGHTALTKGRIQEEELLTQLMAAINEENTEMVKAVFCQTVRDTTLDLDTQIDAMFEFLEGDITGYEHQAMHSNESREQDTHTQEIYWAYNLTTTKNEYCFSFKYCTDDTENPSNVGMHFINLIQAENVNSYGVYWGDQDEHYGILIE